MTTSYCLARYFFDILSPPSPNMGHTWNYDLARSCFPLNNNVEKNAETNLFERSNAKARIWGIHQFGSDLRAIEKFGCGSKSRVRPPPLTLPSPNQESSKMTKTLSTWFSQMQLIRFIIQCNSCHHNNDDYRDGGGGDDDKESLLRNDDGD